MRLYSDMLPMNLQYFAEEDPAGGDRPSTHTPDNDNPDNQKGNNNPPKENDNPGDGKPKPDSKLPQTQEELDKMLAEREERGARKAKKDMSESQKFHDMSESEKMQKQINDLQTKLQEQADDLSKTKQANEHAKMLQEVDKKFKDNKISLAPEEIELYVGKDADETKKKVDLALSTFGKLKNGYDKGNLEENNSKTHINNKNSNIDFTKGEADNQKRVAKAFGIDN